MVGAFSISGFPLFNGFVSKSIIVSAAGEAHHLAAMLLLMLASVGTFLHTGLKIPVFTWAGPARDLQLVPVPPTMYAAMGLTAALNIGIGLVPGPFYGLLPFPVDYLPYTAPKVVDTLQLLVFTGLGFWLLVRKLGGEPTITLDTDWVYRHLPRVAASHVPAAAGLVAAAGAPLRRITRSPGPRWRVPGTRAGAPWPLWMLGLVVLATFLLVLVSDLTP
jgi:multicomponent Na+:H+ antiporter subunit D